jgi:tetratricopeptide (TPR) repeat protein
MLVGNIAYVRGDLATARQHYEHTLASYERTLSSTHVELGNALQAAGIVAMDLGELERAAAMFARAGDIYRAAFGPEHPKVAMVESNLGEVRRRAGAPAEALTHYQRALAIVDRAAGNRVASAGYRVNMGLALTALGRCREAEPHFREATAVFRAELGPDTAMAAYGLAGSGDCALRRGDIRAAIALFEQALALREAAGIRGIDLADSQMALARALWRSRRSSRDRARSLAESARDGFASAGATEEAAAAAAWLAAPR